MADCKRLAALKALTTYLETEITTANGYENNLVGAVFRGRPFFDKTDPLPMICILESPNPDRFPNRAGDQDANQAIQKDLWTIELQGWIQDDKVHPTDPAYNLMADVKKALAKIRRHNANDGNPMYPTVGSPAVPCYLLGGLIAGIKWEAGTVRPPELQSSNAYFWMRVILEFVEDSNDPYAL